MQTKTKLIIAGIAAGILFRGGYYYFNNQKKTQTLNISKIEAKKQEIEKEIQQKESKSKTLAERLEQSMDTHARKYLSLNKQKLSSLSNIFSEIVWELKKEDCENTGEIKWENNYDFNCFIPKQTYKEDKIEETTQQSYIDGKLVMFRSHYNFVNEPINLNAEQKDLKLISFLLQDYAFMGIFLDHNFMAKDLEFDLESYKKALTFMNIHKKDKNYKKRVENLFHSIEETQKVLKFQCDQLKHQPACRVDNEITKLDLRGIYQHEVVMD